MSSALERAGVRKGSVRAASERARAGEELKERMVDLTFLWGEDPLKKGERPRPRRVPRISLDRCSGRKTIVRGEWLVFVAARFF